MCLFTINPGEGLNVTFSHLFRYSSRGRAKSLLFIQPNSTVFFSGGTICAEYASIKLTSGETPLKDKKGKMEKNEENTNIRTMSSIVELVPVGPGATSSAANYLNF